MELVAVAPSVVLEVLLRPYGPSLPCCYYDCFKTVRVGGKEEEEEGEGEAFTMRRYDVAGVLAARSATEAVAFPYFTDAGERR